MVERNALDGITRDAEMIEKDKWIKEMLNFIERDQMCDQTQLVKYEEIIAELEDKMRQRALVMNKLKEIPIRN
jgi:hypothetical protein